MHEKDVEEDVLSIWIMGDASFVIEGFGGNLNDLSLRAGSHVSLTLDNEELIDEDIRAWGQVTVASVTPGHSTWDWTWVSYVEGMVSRATPSGDFAPDVHELVGVSVEMRPFSASDTPIDDTRDLPKFRLQLSPLFRRAADGTILRSDAFGLDVDILLWEVGGGHALVHILSELSLSENTEDSFEPLELYINRGSQDGMEFLTVIAGSELISSKLDNIDWEDWFHFEAELEESDLSEDFIAIHFDKATIYYGHTEDIDNGRGEEYVFNEKLSFDWVLDRDPGNDDYELTHELDLELVGVIRLEMDIKFDHFDLGLDEEEQEDDWVTRFIHVEFEDADFCVTLGDATLEEPVFDEKISMKYLLEPEPNDNDLVLWEYLHIFLGDDGPVRLVIDAPFEDIQCTYFDWWKIGCVHLDSPWTCAYVPTLNVWGMIFEDGKCAVSTDIIFKGFGAWPSDQTWPVKSKASKRGPADWSKYDVDFGGDQFLSERIQLGINYQRPGQERYSFSKGEVTTEDTYIEADVCLSFFDNIRVFAVAGVNGIIPLFIEANGRVEAASSDDNDSGGNPPLFNVDRVRLMEARGRIEGVLAFWEDDSTDMNAEFRAEAYTADGEDTTSPNEGFGTDLTLLLDIIAGGACPQFFSTEHDWQLQLTCHGYLEAQQSQEHDDDEVSDDSTIHLTGRLGWTFDVSEGLDHYTYVDVPDLVNISQSFSIHSVKDEHVTVGDEHFYFGDGLVQLHDYRLAWGEGDHHEWSNIISIWNIAGWDLDPAGTAEENSAIVRFEVTDMSEKSEHPELGYDSGVSSGTIDVSCPHFRARASKIHVACLLAGEMAGREKDEQQENLNVWVAESLSIDWLWDMTQMEGITSEHNVLSHRLSVLHRDFAAEHNLTIEEEQSGHFNHAAMVIDMSATLKAFDGDIHEEAVLSMELGRFAKESFEEALYVNTTWNDMHSGHFGGRLGFDAHVSLDYPVVLDEATNVHSLLFPRMNMAARAQSYEGVGDAGGLNKAQWTAKDDMGVSLHMQHSVDTLATSMVMEMYYEEADDPDADVAIEMEMDAEWMELALRNDEANEILVLGMASTDMHTIMHDDETDDNGEAADYEEMYASFGVKNPFTVPFWELTKRVGASMVGSLMSGLTALPAFPMEHKLAVYMHEGAEDLRAEVTAAFCANDADDDANVVFSNAVIDAKFGAFEDVCSAAFFARPDWPLTFTTPSSSPTMMPEPAMYNEVKVDVSSELRGSGLTAATFSDPANNFVFRASVSQVLDLRPKDINITTVRDVYSDERRRRAAVGVISETRKLTSVVGIEVNYTVAIMIDAVRDDDSEGDDVASPAEIALALVTEPLQEASMGGSDDNDDDTGGSGLLALFQQVADEQGLANVFENVTEVAAPKIDEEVVVGDLVTQNPTGAPTGMPTVTPTGAPTGMPTVFLLSVRDKSGGDDSGDDGSGDDGSGNMAPVIGGAVGGGVVILGIIVYYILGQQSPLSKSPTKVVPDHDPV